MMILVEKNIRIKKEKIYGRKYEKPRGRTT